jgi:hypothetical protein
LQVAPLLPPNPIWTPHSPVHQMRQCCSAAYEKQHIDHTKDSISQSSSCFSYFQNQQAMPEKFKYLCNAKPHNWTTRMGWEQYREHLVLCNPLQSHILQSIVLFSARHGG